MVEDVEAWLDGPASEEPAFLLSIIHHISCDKTISSPWMSALQTQDTKRARPPEQPVTFKKRKPFPYL